MKMIMIPDMEMSHALTPAMPQQQPDPPRAETGPLAIMGTNNNNPAQDANFVNVNVDGDSSDEDGPPPPQNQDQVQDDLKNELTFSPYYHVLRFTRPLRRAEVLGFVFVFLSIVRKLIDF